MTGEETFEISNLDAGITEAAPINVTATALDGMEMSFDVLADVRSPYETDCLKSGGVLIKVMNAYIAEAGTA